MSHQLTKLILILLLLTLPQPANAYWLENEPEPFSLREREHAPPTKGKMLFAVQDNFKLFTDKIEHSPFLLPHSDYFVPADIINPNLPIFGFFSHPSRPAKDPLANILYANLRVKKILDEYAAVQARAEDLLDPANHKKVAGKITVAEILNNEAGNQQNNTEKSPSFYNEISALQNSLAAITVTGNVPIIFMDNGKNARPAEGNGNNTPSTNLEKKLSSTMRSAPPAAHEIAIQNTGKMNVSESRFGYSSQELQTQSNSGQKENQEVYSDDIAIPWFFDLPSTIFHYCLSHPAQTFLICASTLILFNIIFGSRFH
jgi:hypothetical protein